MPSPGPARRWPSRGEAGGEKSRSVMTPKGKGKTYVEHRPLRRAVGTYGRAGTTGTEPGVGEPPGARAPAGLRRWLLT